MYIYSQEISNSLHNPKNQKEPFPLKPLPKKKKTNIETSKASHSRTKSKIAHQYKIL